MEPMLLRENEALALLGIGRSTMRRLLQHGDLQSVRIGRARRITTASVHAWVARQIEVEEARRYLLDGTEPAERQASVFHHDGL